MKNFVKFLGVIAIVAVIGFSFAACYVADDNGGGGGGSGGGGNSAPAVPTGLTAYAYSSSEIILTWNLVSGATGYRVYASASYSGTYTLIGQITTNVGRNYNMTPNTTRYYKVAAYNGYGESDYSNIASATTANDSGGGHTHTYSDTWSSNATQHWLECTEGDGARIAEGNHTFNGNICSMCGYNNSGGDPNGPTNWSAVSDSAFGTTAIYGIAYGNNTWVAGGGEGNGKIAYSSDGRNWTAASGNILSYFRDVAYGAGVFVAVGGGKKAYSPDGRSWTLCSQDDVTDDNIDYVNNMFIAAGDRGRMAYSTNGINWNFVTAADVFDAGTNQNIRGFAFGNNRIVGVCAGGKIGYSTNGTSWTAVSNSTFGSSNIRAIAYGGGRFVAVGASGKAAYSTNGTSWTAVSNSTFGTTTIYGIAFGGNRFVAVGAGGKAAYSTDGVSWTAISNTTFGTTSIYGIAYENGRFVAVGDGGKMAYCDW